MAIVRSPGGTDFLRESSRAIIGKGRFLGRFDATSSLSETGQGLQSGIRRGARRIQAVRKCIKPTGLVKSAFPGSMAVNVAAAESSAIFNNAMNLSLGCATAVSAVCACQPFLGCTGDPMPSTCPPAR
jgi:hypothetical protein